MLLIDDFPRRNGASERACAELISEKTGDAGRARVDRFFCIVFLPGRVLRARQQCRATMAKRPSKTLMAAVWYRTGLERWSARFVLDFASSLVHSLGFFCSFCLRYIMPALGRKSRVDIYLYRYIKKKNNRRNRDVKEKRSIKRCFKRLKRFLVVGFVVVLFFFRCFFAMIWASGQRSIVAQLSGASWR